MCWYCQQVLRECVRARNDGGCKSGLSVLEWLWKKMDLWGDVLVLRFGLCLRSGERVCLLRTNRHVAWKTCGRWMMLTESGFALSRKEMGEAWTFGG